jgi:hypothetical protein
MIMVGFLIFVLSFTLPFFLKKKIKRNIGSQNCLLSQFPTYFQDFERKRGVWEFRGVVDTNNVKKGYHFKVLQTDSQLQKVYDLMENYIGNRGPGPMYVES